MSSKIKPIIFNSGAGNVLIKNRLAHFQNALYEEDYLDPTKHHSITPRQLMIELNFKNPACPKNNAFPSLICAPYVHVVKDWETVPWDIWIYNNEIKLEDFYNVHKYYLNTSKMYTLEDLFYEWTAKEELAFATRKAYNEQLGESGQVSNYDDSLLAATTRFLNYTGDSVIFGQYAVEGYGGDIPGIEKVILFFHYKFAHKLKIEDQMDQVAYVSGEKYYLIMPRAGNSQKTIEFSANDKSLLFKTPTLLQIKCKNISSYPFDDDYCKTIAVINIKEEDKYSSLHYTFKGNEFFPLENKLNKSFEIEITDENNKRLRLYDGNPTILAVDVAEGEMENERKILCSSKKLEIYPKNKPTEFTSILGGEPLNLDSDWKVALSSIIFKNDFKYDEMYNFQFSYKQYDHDGNVKFARTVKIGDHIKTVNEIFDAFHLALYSHVEEGDSESPKNEAQVGHVLLTHEGIVTIRFPFGTKISFTPHLAMILGVVNTTYNPADINFYDESISYEIGFDSPGVSNQNGGTFIGAIPIDFKFDLSQKFCFIEADIIREIAVGSGYGHVLKVISLSNEQRGGFIKKDFDVLDWHPLKTHYIQKISFKLLSQSGNLLSLMDKSAGDYDISWLQLIFKKFPKYD